MANNGYQYKEWNAGDVITKNALNDMEHGIADVVLIQEQNPSDDPTVNNGKYNKLWINSNIDVVEIPTYEEITFMNNNLAPQYSDLVFPVLKGQYCIHENKLYMASQNIINSEEWNDTNWIQINLGDILFDTIKKIYPTSNQKGKCLFFDNTINAPIDDIIIYGKCIQDGTPTISNPIEINTTGSNGNLKIVCSKKNIVPFPYGEDTVVAGGVTFTSQQDGSVRIQGTAINNMATYVMVGNNRTKNALIKGQRYKVTTYNGGNKGYGPWDDCWFQVWSNDNGITGNDKGYDVFTWRDSNDCNMAIRVANGKTVDTTVYPMVQLLSTNGQVYESPYSVSYTLPLANSLRGIPVANGGNYQDTDGQRWICDTIDKNVYIQRCGVINSYNNEVISGAYMSTTGELSSGATIIYELETPIVTNLTNEQASIFTNIITYDNNTVLYVADPITPDIYATVKINKEKEENLIQEYYMEEMEDTIKKIRKVNNEPSLVFPWVTDIHRYTSPVQTFDDMIKNITYLTKHIKCDFILNSGDTIEGDQKQELSLKYIEDMINEFKSINVPIYYAEGNHDNNPYSESGSQIFNLKQIFGAYFSHIKNANFNINENGTDYYFDYNNIGVRFIVLNSCNTTIAHNYGFGNSTDTWLENALNTDNAVILALHVSPIKEHLWNGAGITNADKIKAKLNNFINQGGKLVVLSAHSHIDAEFISPFVEIVNVCQKFEEAAVSAIEYQAIEGQVNGLRAPSRVEGTYTADAWSVVVYKPFSDEIDLIRFGAGVDRYIHYTTRGAGTVTTQLNGNITWHTTDSNIATVSNGVISINGNGKCAIYAKDIVGNIEIWIIENL